MTVPIFNMTDTWNDAGTNFTSIQMNVTNTASGASSLMLDLQLGSTSVGSLTKLGVLRLFNPFAGFSSGGLAAIYIGGGTINFAADTFANNTFYTDASNNIHHFGGSDFTGIAIAAGGSNDARLGFHSGTSSLGTTDAYFSRDAANILAIKRTTNAQTFRVYNTFTDASNYERAQVGWSGNVLTVGVEAAGTGNSQRAIVLQNNGQGISIGGASPIYLTTNATTTQYARWDSQGLYQSSGGGLVWSQVSGGFNSGVFTSAIYQSAPFMLQVTQSNGFASSVGFGWLLDISNNLTNCSTLGGII